MNLSSIPYVILRKLCSFLRYRDVCVLSRVCKVLYNETNDDMIWKDQMDITWWPEHAGTYPFDTNSKTIKEKLCDRILHIKSILENEPVMTLLLYSKMNGESRHYKINLKRNETQLTNQIAAINGIQRPFRVTINLPDGRKEVFCSTILRRYAKPIYYRIGVEYAIHTFSEANLKIPYESRISFHNIVLKYDKQRRKNLRETRKYLLGIKQLKDSGGIT